MARKTPTGLAWKEGYSVRPHKGQRWWIQMVRRDGVREEVCRGPFHNQAQAEGALARILIGKWMVYCSGYVLTKRNPTNYSWAGAGVKWRVVGEILRIGLAMDLHPVNAR